MCVYVSAGSSIFHRIRGAKIFLLSFGDAAAADGVIGILKYTGKRTASISVFPSSSSFSSSSMYLLGAGINYILLWERM